MEVPDYRAENDEHGVLVPCPVEGLVESVQEDLDALDDLQHDVRFYADRLVLGHLVHQAEDLPYLRSTSILPLDLRAEKKDSLSILSSSLFSILRQIEPLLYGRVGAKSRDCGDQRKKRSDKSKFS